MMLYTFIYDEWNKQVFDFVESTDKKIKINSFIGVSKVMENLFLE